LIVVDASAVLELLLRTERGIRIAERALDPRERMHAPHLLDIEVAQTLRRLVLFKELHSARAELALDDYLALVIIRHGHAGLMPRLWQLRATLTAYDAVYVALAEGLGAPLLTCDGKLARAHGHRAVVDYVT
jgi:predicted nucleic acid-binding protein